ncbi:MAG: acyltransferase domain-containing protein [Deltaproteobacteria bacterium]|nr:acyltransferase domain-containing protein [Deltaproteobacteria bacterium]
MSDLNDTNAGNSVAIIGMSGRFPGANNISEFWEVLTQGLETIRHFTKEELLAEDFDAEYVLRQENFIRARGVLENIELFDAEFFCFTPAEAIFTDPQQRVWLELAYEALDVAGYARPDNDSAIGVYTGYLNSTYLMHNLLKNRTDVENYVRTRYSNDFSYMINNTNSYIATRTAYKLNLRGPAINLQTACSTSLVSIILAVQSLLQFESDICIAGGINIAVPQTTGYFHQEGAIHSNDGHCRPFDASAAGTVFGSGGGAVVLKRLDEAIEDQDHIYAVIRGAAMNNDGANKVGFTAPSVEGQAACIALAQSIAEVAPESISYIEAHGTGTPMGDPIEVAGLVRAFGDCDGKRHFCGLGSVKSNIGHLDAGAGIAGLIKTVLSLQNKKIPATLHFKKPNPAINFSDTPFFVVDKLTDWDTNGNPRRAGVSSFGVGGTNAHLILEEAPPVQVSGESRHHQLLLFSAKTQNSVIGFAQSLADAFSVNAQLNVADAAWTLLKKRQRFVARRFVVCDNDSRSAATNLKSLKVPLSGSGQCIALPDKIAFGFPGQGSHYYGMGEQLADHEPVFKSTLAECCELANQFIDEDLSEIFTTKISTDEYASRMNHNGIAQLAIFSVDYSIAKLWLSWGLQPEYLLGHSLGEWVAACISGVLSLEHAIEAVWHRGRLMQSVSGDGGALTVFSDFETIKPYLKSDNHFAAENAPQLTLISGPQKAIKALKQRLDDAEIKSRELSISVAVHSPVLDQVIAPFEEILRSLPFKQPTIPILSTATGEQLSPQQTVDPAYWAGQLRKPVQFRTAIDALWRAGKLVAMIECGPGNALSSLCRLQGAEATRHIAVSSLGGPKNLHEHKQLLTAVGKLWVSGVEVDTEAFFAHEQRKIAPIPAYCFDRKRYWVDPPAVSTDYQRDIQTVTSASDGRITSASAVAAASSPKDVESVLKQIWSEVLGVTNIESSDNFRDLGGDSLGAVRLMECIRKETGVGLPLSALDSAPTIVELAKLITADGAATEELGGAGKSCLVPVKQATVGSNRPILFIPHGGGGDVHWGYVNISAGFDKEQAIWGFEHPKDRKFDSFSEMAIYYVDQLKHVQPLGPYYLAGYCFSGVLAYTMACELRKRGEHVAFLGIMEAEPAGPEPTKISINKDFITGLAVNMPITVRTLLNQSPEQRKTKFLKRIIHLKESGAYKLGKMLNLPTDERHPDRQITAADLLRGAEQIPDEMMEVWNHNLQLFQNHISAMSDIALEVFRTRQQPLFSSHDPSLGWRRLTSANVTCHTVEGNHVTVVEPPYAAQLGRVVQERLRIAQEQNSRGQGK